MQIDGFVVLAGLLVGFIVGLTGMGGGALMTPILVLLFRVQPLAAVSSDLVAAMVMKPVGGAVHMRRGTVHRDLVRWLVVGSIPFAFAGVLLLKLFGDSEQVQSRLKITLGIALLLAAASIVAKGILQARRRRQQRSTVASGFGPPGIEPTPFAVKPLPTVLIGAVGGLVVGMTSVGSGSLIIVFLLLLYPTLSSRELVGTDLVQAIPLVVSAAIGHILFGDFEVSLTASILLGSLPGVYLGARVSSRAPDGVVRPVLVFVLVASGLKLVDVGTVQLGFALLGLVLVALPIWGAIDAATLPASHWTVAGKSRARWIAVQALGAPFLVGFGAAVAYFLRIRREISEAGLRMFVAVFGDETMA